MIKEVCIIGLTGTLRQERLSLSTLPTITVSQSDNTLTIHLVGGWRTSCVQNIADSLNSLEVSPDRNLIVNLSGLECLDTAGAYLVAKFLKNIEKTGISYEIKEGSAEVTDILRTVRKFAALPPPSHQKSPRSRLAYGLNTIGKGTIQHSKTLLEALSFLGEVTIHMIKTGLRPGRLRLVSLIDLMHKTGVNALPIVGLISFLIGVVLVYQGADQLRRFGAEIFTINLLAVSVLRELGILLTAIVVAGRSGSAYTAQLGFMKLNQEIDALYVLGFDPVDVLVIPRVLALVIVLPLLTFFADMMALVGGGIATYFLIGTGPADFSKHLLLSIKDWTFWTGIVKAPVFAFVIALTACFEGLRVSGGAESVGRRTTQSVVEGIFLVIVLDAAFSILFSFLEI